MKAQAKYERQYPRRRQTKDESPSLWQPSFSGKVTSLHVCVCAGEMTIFNQTAGDTSVRRLGTLQLGAQMSKKWSNTNHFPSSPPTIPADKTGLSVKRSPGN